MKYDAKLCPFSKPILSKWCSCEYAKLAERCSGKMSCLGAKGLKETCEYLDRSFKSNTRFILGQLNETDALTHSQLMKIRCGGLIGMNKTLYTEDIQNIEIPLLINKVKDVYGGIDGFPFNEIVQDIKNFKHRK